MCSWFIAKADVFFPSLPQQQKQALLASSACDTFSAAVAVAAAVVYEVAPCLLVVVGSLVMFADPPGNPRAGGGDFAVPLQLPGILTVYTVPLALFHPIRTHTQNNATLTSSSG